jgi:hypothetical protein
MNHKGNGYPLAVVVTLCLVMVLTCISEYFRLMIVAKGVRDALQDAVISTVNDNYDEVYHGVREGYSGGYQPMDEDFEESLDYGDIYEQLDGILGLEQSGEEHIRTSSKGEQEFSIRNLEVEIRNAPLAGGDRAEQRFEIDGSVLLEVPVSFGGTLLPPMQIKVKIRGGYSPRF